MRYASTYPGQTDPKDRAEALMAFCRCPYPDNPAAIIEDTRSTCKSLKETAWQVLENIRLPPVRGFAVENPKSNVQTALPLFLKNYQPRDAALLRHIYETTYCSICREHALRQMGKHRVLTDGILQECLLDSNDDIRAYAKQCLRFTGPLLPEKHP